LTLQTFLLVFLKKVWLTDGIRIRNVSRVS
jgi:hypothetical protein